MPTKRAYASPLREKAAAQTREAILQAATELFGRRGYGRGRRREVPPELEGRQLANGRCARCLHALDERGDLRVKLRHVGGPPAPRI